jgi:nucleotide-binding universal stress UspA family protein
MTENKQKILVAYDGSECADEALQDLRRAGLDQECNVHVISVADVIVPPPLSADESYPKVVPRAVELAYARVKEKIREAEHLAKQASDRIKADCPLWNVTWEALADSPAWAIIKKADEWKPDLIVMGARGLSDFGGRLILGSISQRVLYEASCSVRISRALGQRDRAVRVLVGVDNSVDSRAAVQFVCDRNWPEGSEVGLVAVVDTVMQIGDPSDPQDSAKWIEVSAEETWDQVRAVFEPDLARLRQQGLHAEVLIRRGNPANQIIEEAHTWGADCIFLGARGTRGIDRILLGSVSSAVSARAHCSVEVVRTAE